MKCLYHVSFIQQQTLLASITGANNMLLIWFQEAVSRQLRFQLLSSGERTRNVPVPLLQESWQQGAHSCQLSLWDKEKPKQAFLSSCNPPALTHCWFHWGCSAAPQTQGSEHWPLSLQSWGKNQQGSCPRHCCGLSPSLPHAHLLSQLAFHKLPPSSCALQFCSIQK